MRHRRSFMAPRRLARALCVMLGAASVGSCGGGPDGTVGSAVSLDVGSATTASLSAAVSAVSAGTLVVSAQSTIAQPLASGAVLFSNAVVPRSGAIESTAFPGLLRWEPSTRRVTHAMRLELPLDALRATLGEAASTAFRSQIADTRALPDGGALVQFDLLADAPGVPARRAASVLARLRADLSVAWTRTWAGGQSGRIEVRDDAVTTTGEAFMRYDGLGRPVSQESLGDGGFVLTLPSATEVIGVAGGFVLRGAAGGDRFVCRLAADLSVQACITGRDGRRQAGATVRADTLGERLYVAGHADGAPALVLGPDLGVRFDPGATIEGFAITRGTWHVSWAETALAAPAPAGRMALAITASPAVLPAEALDTRALGALSATPRPAGP